MNQHQNLCSYLVFTLLSLFRLFTARYRQVNSEPLGVGLSADETEKVSGALFVCRVTPKHLK
jgi:hypothetical protein